MRPHSLISLLTRRLVLGSVLLTIVNIALVTAITAWIATSFSARRFPARSAVWKPPCRACRTGRCGFLPASVDP